MDILQSPNLIVSKMISGAARIKTVELAGFQPRRISRVRGARQSKKLMQRIKEIASMASLEVPNMP
jgi:hypothetical protein